MLDWLQNLWARLQFRDPAAPANGPIRITFWRVGSVVVAIFLFHASVSFIGNRWNRTMELSNSTVTEGSYETRLKETMAKERAGLREEIARAKLACISTGIDTAKAAERLYNIDEIEERCSERLDKYEPKNFYERVFKMK